MIWYVCAAFFPCILVVLFSVVTRSKWIGTLVTLVIIGASVYKGILSQRMDYFYRCDKFISWLFNN